MSRRLPLEIPGYYFDPEKNRYFKRPPGGQASGTAPAAGPRSQGPRTSTDAVGSGGRGRGPSQKKARLEARPGSREEGTGGVSPRYDERGLGSAPSALRSSGPLVYGVAISNTGTAMPEQVRRMRGHVGGSAEMERRRHAMLSALFARTTRQMSRPAALQWEIGDGEAAITSMTASSDGSVLFYGDSVGALRRMPLSDLEPPSCDWTFPAPVSSIQVSRRGVILATWLGAPSKALLMTLAHERSWSLTEPLSPTMLIEPRKTNLWTSSLFETDVVLGCDQSLMVSRALPHSWGNMVPLWTGSDVFAVDQAQDSIYAGTRSGSLHRYDKRLLPQQGGQAQGHSLKEESKPPNRLLKARSGITHVKLIGDNTSVLVAGISGELDIYDLRFLTTDPKASTDLVARPVMSLHGHSNKYSRDLGLDVDPTSSFLAAAGQDGRVRLWSLRTGALLTSCQDQCQRQDGEEGRAPSQDQDRVRIGARLFGAPVKAVKFCEAPRLASVLADEKDRGGVTGCTSGLAVGTGMRIELYG